MTKRILGITSMSHDASVTVIEGNEILFAAHAERSSGIKNDKDLSSELIAEALSYGMPDLIAFYEKPLLKKTRQMYAGQWNKAFNSNTLISNYIFNNAPELKDVPIKTVSHHLSHAAASALTSGYNDACVVVADAIGEWDCLTIWEYTAPNSFKRLYSAKYPDSLGLFYTAITDRVGLKPNEDEYILMGMAAYGKPVYALDMIGTFFEDGALCKTKHNLHLGCEWYQPGADIYDLAASAQMAIEIKIDELMEYAKSISSSDNLVYSGGVALNCVANRIPKKYFNNMWIMPNPGDAGSSLGAAAYLSGGPVKWNGAFLGHNIDNEYPVMRSVDALINGDIIGVACGRAEFGPRALGHRSLIADPRGNEIKDRVNEIKHRQKFRPFAPAILEEYVHDYFDLPTDASPYMQYVGTCKYPDDYPAIVHKDGTSRVQTVNKKDNPNFYALIKEFYNRTGCPMVLNTSLNIKGKPMVDNEEDAAEFEAKYGIKVFTSEYKT